MLDTVQVHAHQVLDILDQQTGSITLDELRAKVAAAFGANAVFTNCHDDAFNFEQLVDFMLARQKIILSNGNVQLNKVNVCNH